MNVFGFRLGGKFFCAGLIALLVSASMAQKTLRVDDMLPQKSDVLAKMSKSSVSQAIEQAAAQLKAGDALILPRLAKFGIVNMPELPEDVQILGGEGEEIILKSRSDGTVFHGGDYHLNLAKNGATLENSFFIERRGSISGGNFENTYWVSNIGTLDINGTMRNCTGVWMRYNHEGSKGTKASYSFDLNGTGQNVRILQMVEHNQGNLRPALHVKNADGIAFANGSTEGSSGHEEERWVTKIENSKNVYLGHRRFFSGHPTNYKVPLFEGGGSWVGYPDTQVVIDGSHGTILDNVVDIGNTKFVSLVSRDDSIQAWSTIWEDLAVFTNDESRFVYSLTWQGMEPVLGWQEPRSIQREELLKYYANGEEIDLTQPGASLPAGHCVPTPPLVPTNNIPKPPALMFKRAENFGSALLAAGADPSGRTASNEAFEKMLSTNPVVEIPAGTYLIDGPIKISGEAARRGKVKFIGAGSESVQLVGKGSGSVLSFQSGGGLAKGNIKYDLSVVGLTCSGKDYCVMLAGHNNTFMDVTFEGQTIAGVAQLSSEAEQHRFISCKFIGGEYGVRFDTYQDKPLFYRCFFENQSKGGIYTTNIVHFHGGVFDCHFKNINGPGLAIYGGNEGPGYGPWIISVDGCTFEECGNENEAALDIGYNWLGAVLNTKIITKNKTIKTGFRGNFGVLQDLEVDVKTPDNKALYLGHQRYEKTAGIGGARLMNVNAHSGDLYFMPLEEAMTYQATELGYEDGFLNSALYSEYPNAFTYMFFNVQSGNYNVSYAMLNNGEVMVDMSQYESCGPVPINVKTLNNQQQINRKASPRNYDLKGRLLKIYEKASTIENQQGNLILPVR